jgi:hypothetical protein
MGMRLSPQVIGQTLQHEMGRNRERPTPGRIMLASL